MSKVKVKILVAVAVIGLPLLLWARSSGPEPGYAGVPSEGTCAQAICHTGSLNPSGATVAISAAGGDSYTPGTPQVLTITINDPGNTAAGRRFGFQATVRASGSTTTQFGTLRATSTATFVYCAGTNVFIDFAEKTGATCAANRPFEYVQHSSPNTSGTFTFEWTPPSGGTGNAIIYVSANSANGNGQSTGDRIITATKTITPATTAPRPSINTGGVVSVLNYGGSPTTAPGGWIEIYGANLSATTRQWAGSDFNGNNAPTALDGVSVTIGGQPAFVFFISPGQLNVQTPKIPAGPSILTVKTANGTSDNYTLQVADRSPGLLAPASFKIGNQQFIANIHPDTTASSTIFYGAPNLIQGLPFRALAPGQVFLLYGIAMGTVTPNIDPGIIVGQANALPNVILMAGNTTLQTNYAGLAGGFIGLYQFNVVVPDIPNGNYPLTGSIGGVPLPSGLFISIQRP